jgi:molybdenum cofactor synthesis domain-containing protein
MAKGGFREYTPFSAALGSIVSEVKPLPPVSVPFAKAAGAVLAEDVFAPEDIPPFDRSAVDGFAVRASATFGATPAKPVKLRLVGKIPVGGKPGLKLGGKETAEIATGAPMPEGSDAVVMVEHTKVREGFVEVMQPLTPSKNVSACGEDVEKGELVLKAGALLRPQEIGMLAALRRIRVRVIPRPRVAIITTGGELSSPWKPRGRWKTIDVNSYSLSAATAKCGGVVEVLKRVPDDPKLLEREILRCLGCDLILVSGGSSVGESDIAPAVAAKLGRLVFHGVAMRPGGPTAFAVIEGKPLFCLPGFPVAALISFRLLVRPALMRLRGLPADYGRQTVKAKLSREVWSTLGRTEIVRVRLRSLGRQRLAEPLRITGSGVLSSMTSADGFVLIPENREGLERGELVEVELF